MKIYKDKKYLLVYCIVVFLDIVLLVSAITLTVYLLTNINGFMAEKILVIILSFILSIFACVLGINSLIGYLKSPQILAFIKDNFLSLTPDKKNDEVCIKINDIKTIHVKHKIICRSGKRLVIDTNNGTYYLEDVLNIDLTCQKINEYIKKILAMND